MFEKVAIGIRTFLRDEHLFNATTGIEQNMPRAKMIIVDDGRGSPEKTAEYFYLRQQAHEVWEMTFFDFGFGAKSNKMADIFLNTNREYLLIGSDDFNFTEEAANGILKLQEVLDFNPEFGIASGRVNNRPYEFFLEEQDGVVHEYPVHILGMLPWFYQVDLTVNYSLVRREVLRKVGWDNDVKIGGGEHGAFFLDVKRAGFKVAFVPGVNINEQQLRSSAEYRQYRARANSPARPCFERRGVKKYVLGDGRVDYAVS